MSRSERDLVSALRAELAAIDPSRSCDRRAEAAGLGAASPSREGPVARLAIRLGRGRVRGRGASAGPAGGQEAGLRLAIRGRALPAGLPPRPVPRPRLAEPGERADASRVRRRRRRGAEPRRAARATWRCRHRGDSVAAVESSPGRAATSSSCSCGGSGRAAPSSSSRRARSRAPLRGDLNRVLNAESANLQRAVGAAGRQIAAIDELDGDGRLAEQPYVVRLVADGATRDARGHARGARRAARDPSLGASSARSSASNGSSSTPMRASGAETDHASPAARATDAAAPRSGMIRTMRPVIVAANWKMNTTPADAGDLALTIAARTREPGVVRVICPPFVCLAAVRDALEGAGEDVAVGAQDVHHELAGAYTGDISAAMLVGLATLGHRRPQRAPPRPRRDRRPDLRQAPAGRRGRAAPDPLRRRAARGARGGRRRAGRRERSVRAPSTVTIRPSSATRASSSPTSPSGRSGPAVTPGRRRGGDGGGDPRRGPIDWMGRDRRDDLPVLYGGSVTAANIARVPRRAVDRRRARRRRVAQARRDGRDRRPRRRDGRRPPLRDAAS